MFAADIMKFEDFSEFEFVKRVQGPGILRKKYQLDIIKKIPSPTRLMNI